jgi:hypothetical protein
MVLLVMKLYKKMKSYGIIGNEYLMHPYLYGGLRIYKWVSRRPNEIHRTSLINATEVESTAMQKIKNHSIILI